MRGDRRELRRGGGREAADLVGDELLNLLAASPDGLASGSKGSPRRWS